MSDTIDRRVVEMRFDNREFERNLGKTLTSLGKLKDKLQFKNAGNDFNASGLSTAVDAVKKRFSALEIIGVTTLANLTNSAVNFSKHMLKSLTIDQVRSGFSEYELKMGSIQTIMASTGESIETVNKYLNELNEYSDKTIYSFADMTQNIGKFTNAGVKLEDAVAAIQGISNEAAVSGANANEASRAMYNFAQALSAGYVKLIDWKSVENANMATVEFKQALIDTAVAMGTLEKTTDGYKSTTKDANGSVSDLFTSTRNFNESLSHQWMSTEVLTQTLKNYSSDVRTMTEEERRAYKEKLISIGYTEEQINKIQKLGSKAFDSAQDVKTFTQLMDTLKESVGSGWARTFEILFGNIDEAKKLWTSVKNFADKIINSIADARNGLLEGWKNGGGRFDMIKSFSNIAKAVTKIFLPMKDAFREVFPPTTAKQLKNISNAFRELTSRLIISDNAAKKLKPIFVSIFSVMKFGRDIIIVVSKAFKKLISAILPLGSSCLNLLSGLSLNFNEFGKSVERVTKNIANFTGKILNKLLYGIKEIFMLLGNGLSNFNFTQAGEFLAGGGLLLIAVKIKKFMDTVSTTLGDIGPVKFIGSIKGFFSDLSGALQSFQSSLKAKALMSIALSISILAASCVVLSTIPVPKLLQSVGALGILSGELVVASSLMKGVNAKGLVKLSSAIVILAIAAKMLSSIENVGQGLIAVGVLLAEIGLFCKAFTKYKIKPQKIATTAKGLILMSVALILLSKPVKDLGALNTKELITGLSSIAIMLGGLYLLCKEFNKIESKGLIKTAFSLVLIGTAIKLFVDPIRVLGGMDLKELAKGVIAISAIFIIISSFSKSIGKIATANKGFMKAGVAIALMAVGINLITLAVNGLGNGGLNTWNGIAALAATLVTLSFAVILMTKTMSGAAAMVVVAAALALLAPSIALLSSLNIGGVVIGLLALIATISVFAAASVLLSGAVKYMIALSGAMTLLGVGVLAFGAGVSLLVTALVVMAQAVVQNAQGICASLPLIGDALGQFIIEFAEAIAAGAEPLKKAIVTILDIITTCIGESAPKIIEAAMILIIAFLEGLNNSTEKIVETAICIVINFVNGISNSLEPVLEAGFNLIVSLINGMANALSEKGPEIITAIQGLALSILEVLASAIPVFGDKITGFIRNIREGLGSGEKEIGTSALKIAETTDKNVKVKDQTENGKNITKGLINGMNSLLPDLKVASKDIADVVDKTVRKRNLIKSPSRKTYETSKFLMLGYINGLDSMMSKYKKKADNISTYFVESANSSLDTLSSTMNRSINPKLDFSTSSSIAGGLQISASGILEMRRQENLLEQLNNMMSNLADNIVPNQMNNTITIDGSENPEAFASRLLRSFKLNARTV